VAALAGSAMALNAMAPRLSAVKSDRMGFPS
jgi:hypothetical protein